MFKKIIAPLALVMFLILPISNTYANTTENLSFSTSVKGNITETNKEDKYKINLTKSGKITINAKVSLSNADIKLLNENGETINRDYVGGSEENPKTYTKVFDLSKGTYYISVARDSYTDSTGPYTLKVDYKEVLNDSIEPNNGTETAQNLTLNSKPLNGYITVSNAKDVYKIFLPKSGKITINAKVSLSNADIKLLDKNGETIQRDYVGGSEENPKIYTQSFDLSEGTYYINVARDSYTDSTGAYTLKVDYKEVLNDSIEPNNGTETAQTLTLNSKPLNGYITVSNEKDVYKISLPTRGKITINAKVSLSNADIKLLDKNGETIQRDYVGGSEENPNIYTQSFDLSEGTYYISFSRDSYTDSTGAYTIGVSTAYSADQLYAIAYKAANNATNKGTQEAINEARNAIKALKGTGASWAIGQFSGQVDKVQHKILVRILNAINKAQTSLKQADINEAKAVIDPNLPINWKNSYSSAVDVIQNKLVNKAIDAHKKALSTQSKVDIDAADALIAELKTSSSSSIVQWVKAYFKK